MSSKKIMSDLLGLMALSSIGESELGGIDNPLEVTRVGQFGTNGKPVRFTASGNNKPSNEKRRALRAKRKKRNRKR